MNKMNESSKSSPEGEAAKSVEERADEIIDAVVTAAGELNPQIEKNLKEQTGGSLSDEDHKKNPLDEAHLLSLELKHPEADPLMAMLEKIDNEELRTIVVKLIDTGEMTTGEREKIKKALTDHLLKSQTSSK